MSAMEALIESLLAKQLAHVYNLLAGERLAPPRPRAPERDAHKAPRKATPVEASSSALLPRAALAVAERPGSPSPAACQSDQAVNRRPPDRARIRRS